MINNFEYYTISGVDPNTQKLSFAKTKLHAEIDNASPLGKCVIFSMPGAFTNTCQFHHLPSIASTVDKIEKLGYPVFLLCVNNVDTMHYWYKQQGIDPSRIRPIADPKGILTSSLGIAMESDRLGNVAKRCAIVVQNKTVTWINCDENAAEVCKSSGDVVLQYLNAVK